MRLGISTTETLTDLKTDLVVANNNNISSPVSFPSFTLSITFSVRTLMMCSSSSSKKVHSIVKLYSVYIVKCLTHI